MTKTVEERVAEALNNLGANDTALIVKCRAESPQQDEIDERNPRSYMSNTHFYAGYISIVSDGFRKGFTLNTEVFGILEFEPYPSHHPAMIRSYDKIEEIRTAKDFKQVYRRSRS